jgi:hypothetical protein
MPQRICLVTIHGIGFQHAPLDDGTPGYADPLHEHLRGYLHELLGDDPQRPNGGPVYVQSYWPPDSLRSEPALARLGTWGGDAHRTIITDQSSALVRDPGTIAHVALVYSHLEDVQFLLGSAAETLAKAAVSVGQYSSLGSLVKTGVQDVWAIFGQHGDQSNVPTPSLRIRKETDTPVGADAAPTQAPAAPSGSSAHDVIGQLDDDVAAYVSRNDLRERVRSFVHEALLRICYRDDVDMVVVNAHSQGTVTAFDVLRQLPPQALQKVRCFVTAGSPLRKYADLFCWGRDASCLVQTPWINFYDSRDPVADPLQPDKDWHLGNDLPAQDGKTSMFYAIDPDMGTELPVAVQDVPVDNLKNSTGGGLQAHNYWDNQSQMVKALADRLEELARP